MKTINKVSVLFVCIVVSLMLSCSKEEIIFPKKESLKNTLEEKLLNIPNTTVTNQKAVLTYKGQLCGDVITATHATTHSIANSALWDYYYFEGNAGDEISISVPRTSENMDTAFSLFEGTTTENSEINIFDGGANMTFLEFKDDEVPNPYNSCWKDSELINYILPNTATYTLAVFDFLSCGEPLTYEITTIGIACEKDTDDDGCMDSVDPHPNSNQDATVVIGGCDSGVTNVFVTNCSTMVDLITDCANEATNHGDFVSCVAHLTNEWKETGFISGKEKGKMQSCAGQSSIP